MRSLELTFLHLICNSMYNIFSYLHSEIPYNMQDTFRVVQDMHYETNSCKFKHVSEFQHRILLLTNG